ncbi:MAG: HAMP domain-containing histidine kinase [Bacteroidetes bacterium]|nr:HAMP domain-containing histidine kinase [Bacteroidota bacterium]
MPINSNKNQIDAPYVCENCKELQYEINVLKQQIDNCNMFSLNIRKQNYNLEQKIKKLEKANKNLEEIQKDKNELFAVIIHDIKNPTTIIKSLVELLRTYDTNSEEQKAIIDDLVISTRQVISLSQEISKVLTLEDSAIKMFYEFANPAILVTEVANRNSINAKNKNQTISVDIEDDLPQFSVDVVKICEVFDNMLSNAIKYTNPGGQIGVKCSKVKDMIQFEFSDTGLGMSEEDLKAAFQRGAKLSAKPTGGETSSGLGLWISKKIIETHKGNIRIRSSLGVGTVFIIQIPIEQ